MKRSLNILLLCAFTVANAQNNTVDISSTNSTQSYADTKDDYEGAYNPFPTEETSVNTIEENTSEPTVEEQSEPGIADSTDEAYTDSEEKIDESDTLTGQETTLPLRNIPNQANPSILDQLSRYSQSIQFRGQLVKLASPEKIEDFYAALNYPLAWIDDQGHPNTHAIQLLRAIRKSYQHGFSSNMYNVNSFSAIDKNTTINETAQFDILLTNAFLLMKEHMTNGIVDPKTQFPTWTQSKKQINFVDLYLKVRNGLSVKNALRVQNPEYTHLQKAYARLIKKAEKNQKQGITIPNVKMIFGSSGKAISLLRQRLNLPNSDIYDLDLKNAVKSFQAANGLSADGIVGARTIAKLNNVEIGSQRKINLLKINMERARWQNLPKKTPYIWVNIPAFNMSIRQANSTLFSSNVIVGKPKRKTPIFSDRLEYVVLNPYWNVPTTIFKEDKLPKLKRNPNAFKGMQVLSKATGKVINSSSVNWAAGGAGYNLRQLPGPRNPLGRMKFLFPNKHAIYLHDTSQRHLFKKSVRTFSSGCIRVERALDLASYLLKHKGYNQSKIKATWKGKKERWLNVKKSLGYPVHINYFTAWASENGKIHFSSDVYNYDKKMTNAYQSAINSYL